MIYQGQKTVTTAGTAVPLTTGRFPCSSVTIFPLSTNSDQIRVGGPQRVNTDGTTTPVTSIPSGYGAPLNGGDAVVAFPAGPPGQYDLSTIYIDANVNGEGVQFVAVK